MTLARVSVQKLEELLEINVKDIADEFDWSVSATYTQRKDQSKRYKAILFGYRCMKSDLTPKELLRQIKNAEDLISRSK